MRRKTEFLLFRWLRPHHFLLLMVTSSFLAFICGYAISVGDHIVAALFPSISGTGTETPASCVFGILLHISAVFGIISMYIRHRHFEGNSLDDHKIHVINDISMFLGFLSCIGMTIVANFQASKAMIPHVVGAFMIFVLGNVYCWLQSYLAYHTIGGINKKIKTRIILSTCSALSFVLMFTFGRIAAMKANGKVDVLHWDSNNPGYYAHLVSTFCEWIMVICFLLYFVTFYQEFKNIQSKITINIKMTSGVQVEQQECA